MSIPENDVCSSRVSGPASSHGGRNVSQLLLTRANVEAQYGITKRFLEVAAVRGDGPPFVKIGRSVRYRVCDLDAWIEARRHDPDAVGKRARHR